MAKDLRQFLKGFETALFDVARKGWSIHLETKLTEYERLLRCWLEVAPAGTVTPSAFSFFDHTHRFAGPLEIDLCDLVRAAATSHDEDSYEAVIDALARYLLMARDFDQLSLYRELCRVLAFAYLAGARESRLQEMTVRTFDSRLHSILSRCESRRHAYDRLSEETEASIFNDERSYLDCTLALTLQLIATAMEEGIPKSADYFFQRLVEHRRFDRRRRSPGRKARSVEDSDTLHDYAVTIAGAWALHLLEAQYRNASEAAHSVLRATQDQLPGRHELIALWELYHSENGAIAVVDQRIGVERWDLRDKVEMRIGVSMVRSGGGGWIRKGFLAAMLHARQPSEWELRDFFSSAPSRHMWDPDRTESTLKELAKIRWVELPAEKGDAEVNATLTLLKGRQSAADAHHILRIAITPLEPKLCRKLQGEVVQAFEQHRYWIHVLHDIGCDAEARFAVPVPLQLGRYIPRESLIPHNNWASGLGEFVGQEAALWESVMLVGTASSVAQRTIKLRSLANITETIREAKRLLTDRGLSPTLIILPSQARFAGALFRKPLWQIEDRTETPQIGYGAWDSMRVLKCPFTDAETIIVADARRLFGTVGKKPALPQVLIGDTQKETLEEVAAIARRNMEKLPESNEIRVLVELISKPLYGILDPTAAIAIDITDSDGGYAMEPDQSLYHRSSCRELEFVDEVEYRLLPHLENETEDRKPCDICRPERWDFEGRQGQTVFKK